VRVLTEFESDLAKVPGVKRARVVGDGEPSEIHILASSDRSAKQVVRDVLSLAKAGYEMAIDHRIVSVVQLEDHQPEQANSNGNSNGNGSAPLRSRPVISHVILVNDAYGRRVDLGLEWPDGSTSGGAALLGQSTHSRARAGAEVVVQALNENLKGRRASIDVENAYVVRAPDATETVTVRIAFHEAGTSQTLMGSANCDGDVVAGAARATLHALNRKLSGV